MMTGTKLAAALAGSLLLVIPARGEEMLRIAMTVSDIPTTTAVPNTLRLLSCHRPAGYNRGAAIALPRMLDGTNANSCERQGRSFPLNGLARQHNATAPC
jgi:hypothetical protein